MKIFKKTIKTISKVLSKILFPVKYLSEKNKKITLSASFIIILIMIPISFYVLKHTTLAEAWYDNNYNYRQTISITNAGSTQTNFQVSFTLDTASLISAGKMRSDCNDIRVTDSDGSTLLSYVIEQGSDCNTSSTKIWVKVPTITTSGHTLYIYYGYPSASNGQNGNNVFQFYDDFSSVSNWTIYGTDTTSTGTVTVTTGALVYTAGTIASDAKNLMYEYRFQLNGAATNYAGLNISNVDHGVVNNTESNKLIYSLAETSFTEHGWAADGTTASYNLNNDTSLGYTPSTGTYYVDGFSMDSTNIKWWHSASNTHTTTGKWTAAPYIWLGGYRGSNETSGTDTSDITVDWVRARKYAATEPSAANPTGEETKPATAVGPLLAYWKFDEETGTAANDSSGNASIGTLTGTTLPTWQTKDMCISQGCLYFNGVSSNITAPAINNVQTVSFWAKSATATASFIKLATNIDIKATNGVVGQDGFTSPTIYINGVVNGTYNSDTWNHIELTTATALTADSITIGKMQLGVLNGFLDEIKLYNYARTPSEVLVDYNSRGSIDAGANVLGATTYQNLSNGLIGYWKMDESSGNASDSSGNAVTLTNNGTATFSSGKFGNAPTFNGSTKYFSTATTLSGSQSISFWINPASTTDNFINLASGVYINAASGTISTTGITNPTVYVNGIQSSKISSGIWQFITVTSTSAISASQFEVGRANGSFAANNSLIDEIRLYNRTLSSYDAANLYSFAPAPVGYWNFEEGYGTTVKDTSGGVANTGTWTGTAPFWTQGEYGNGGIFDGTTDYVAAGSNAVLQFTGNFTVSGWFKTTDSGNSTIIASYGTTNDWLYTIYKDTTDKLGCKTYQTNSATAYESALSTQKVNDGAWHHAACTVSGTTISVYVDGVLAGTSSTTAGTRDVSSSGTFTIGKFTNAASLFWNGSLDEVKTYNYARTAGQIITDMNAGHPLGGSPVGSAVGYWKFNEGYGSVANNSGTSSSSSATLITTVWTNDGKSGKALGYDGTASYARVNYSSAFYPAELTSTAWIYPTAAALGNIVSAAGNSGWRYRINANQTITFFDRGATNNVTTTQTVSLNKWSHIAVVGSANGLLIYINGQLAISNTTAYGGTDGGNFIVFGAVAVNTHTETFSGKIDEVKIYNTALSASEIKVDMNQSSALVLGAISDTSGLTAGNVASNSASAQYCVPGDTSTCSSPVGEWNFEEGYETNAQDTSGGGATGAISGAKYTSGKKGKALNFAGGSDAVTVSNTLSTKTVEFWVNPGTTTQNLIDLRTAATAASISVSAGTISATGFTTPTIYVNGIVSSTLVANSWQYVSITTGTAISASAIRFGRISSTSLNGKLDSIRIFDYARSGAQIAWDYSQGDPIGYYKFDECQGSTLNNSTGTQSATFVGTSAVGTCTTVSTFWGGSGGTGVGKINYAPTLNGTGDYIRAGSDFNFTSSDFSISYWINLASLTTNVGGQGPVPIYKGTFNVNGYYNQINTSGGISFITNQAGANQVSNTANGEITTGNWYHITIVRIGASVKIYVNGVDKTTSNPAHINPASSGDFFNIGRYKSGNILTNGQIDEVKIFNYGLTTSQVKQVYNQGSAVRFGP